MKRNKNTEKNEERILTYEEYRAYLNYRARRLDLNKLLKDALTKNG